ncbi:EamA domain-containing membrane protein RarD [Phyllobacterium myrsinacearum]|uniref:DMT family transporter n=1 Tax=Phyllobacterium myrsinacearum TaxID=28101 RepID=UPI001028A673|nr:DMT family transporter [Phyllobacterium myrsinacearum]RZS82101.1 EamA domain-containing membrane protein RarD [Phyllobacterium myrsinacearum]
MNRTAYIFLLVTALLWGGNAVAGKLAVGHISPMLLTMLRWLIAFAVVAAFSGSQVRRDWKVLRAHLPLLAALGGFGFTFFNMALYTALNYTSAINVTIEQAGMPMVIFVANLLLFGMAVRPGQIFGFSLSLVGVALTAGHGSFLKLAELEVNQGDALMLLAVLFYSGYTVALRLRPAIHWQSLMTVMTFFAFVTAIPFTIWEWLDGALVAPDVTGVMVVLYTALLPSLAAQVLFIKGVEYIGANRAGLFINAVPIFGTLLAVMLLGEAFHLYHAVALVLVLGGIGIAEISGRKHAAA